MLSEKVVFPVLVSAIEKSVPIHDLRLVPLGLWLVQKINIAFTRQVELVRLGILLGFLGHVALIHSVDTGVMEGLLAKLLIQVEKDISS